MAGERDIRRVEVEFLRRGPQHNQLLSPLTDYLAVCEDFPAGVVHVPYEHAEAQNLLLDLRYEVEGAVPSPRVRIVRERAGTNIARMLGSISGLPGSLRKNAASRTNLTHLRLVMSAAELALLPFELSKAPVGPTAGGEEWLGLQPGWPVCITRGVRGVRQGGQPWPTQPRILFVAGPDVPFEESRAAFVELLHAWDEIAVRDDGTVDTDLLTARCDVTVDDVVALMQESTFTHVHVLAHGAEVDDGTGRYGLQFAGDRVLTGADLALALTTRARPCLPSVVTIAACDSGQQGSVVVPGGSVAHDLHTAGVPLVVASQFPISERAARPFVETLYTDFLWGEHPLRSLAALRRRLAIQFPDEHSWASIVAYECLPRDFDDQLAEVRYRQTKRALEAAVRRLERLATADADRIRLLETTGKPFADDFHSPEPDAYRAAREAVTTAVSVLPDSGPWAAECAGLAASAHKRAAEVAFWLSLAPDLDDATGAARAAQSVDDLQESLRRYRATMATMLSTNDAVAHRVAAAHWLVSQVLALTVQLEDRLDDDLAAALRLTAQVDLYLPDHGKRGWANGSLLEGALLQLTAEDPRPGAAALAVDAAHEIVRLCGMHSEQVASTRRQVNRYRYWWSRPEFAAATSATGAPAVDWHRSGGVVETAARVVEILTP